MPRSSAAARFASAALLLLSLSPRVARADAQLALSPGSGYRIDWSPPGANRITQRPSVEHAGASAVDRWFEVAPGGRAVAIWSAPSGVALFRSDGVELWHRDRGVFAFRFSPRGDRLAVASAGTIEVIAIDRPEPKPLAKLRGADWLRWTRFGLVARTRSTLQLIADDGSQRALARTPREAIVAAAGARVVWFTRGSLVDLDLASRAAPQATAIGRRAPVINAELSPNGERLLFATALGVYLREGRGQVRSLADVKSLHSLLFSPDGSAFLWAASAGGALVEPGGSVALPPTRSARFRQDGNSGLVLTLEAGVFTWNAKSGTGSVVGGISPDDGVNLAGDLAGDAAVAFYYAKTVFQKKVEVPKALVP